MGFADGYSVLDGDVTGLVFGVLKQAGSEVDINALLNYEADDHFRCYALEANPSTSVHAHILGSLRRAGLPADALPIQKILGFLQRSKNSSGYWFDKWHLSPYYVTCHIIIASSNYSNQLVLQSVDWILATQNSDGSWGTQLPTAEETAYCVQALWVWSQTQTGAKNKIIIGSYKEGYSLAQRPCPGTISSLMDRKMFILSGERDSFSHPERVSSFRRVVTCPSSRKYPLL